LIIGFNKNLRRAPIDIIYSGVAGISEYRDPSSFILAPVYVSLYYLVL